MSLFIEIIKIIVTINPNVNEVKVLNALNLGYEQFIFAKPKATIFKYC